MSKSIIVLITGFPGTGKTTLGTALSAKYKFPFISKDAFKDRMFDTLGWSDKAWSHKVSAASHRIMDYIIAEEMKAGHSIIVESNFKRDIDSSRFRKIQKKYGCGIVQVLCRADGEIVFKRFMDRIGTAARHAGHVEDVLAETIRQEFVTAKGRDTPLDVDGTTIEIDTTDFERADYEPLYVAIRSSLA